MPIRRHGIGEAATPGPSLCILIANATSWAAAWRGFLAAEGDVWGVQEARIAAKDCAVVTAETRAVGILLRPGQVVGNEHLPSTSLLSLTAVARAISGPRCH